jgi:hypothetical protein
MILLHRRILKGEAKEKGRRCRWKRRLHGGMPRKKKCKFLQSWELKYRNILENMLRQLLWFHFEHFSSIRNRFRSVWYDMCSGISSWNLHPSSGNTVLSITDLIIFRTIVLCCWVAFTVFARCAICINQNHSWILSKIELLLKSSVFSRQTYLHLYIYFKILYIYFWINLLHLFSNRLSY